MSLSVPDMLKEGTRHLSGKEDVVLQSINAVKELSKITRTSYGPNGFNKMIINHLEKLFVTSDAATILKELDVIHPAAKLVVMSSQMQEQEIGDGTNYVLILSGELLQSAEALLSQGLHPSEIVSGFILAQQKTQEILKELVSFTVTDIKDQTQVTKCLKSVIAAKQYGYEDLLTPMIVKACIQVLPKDPRGFNVDNVRVAKIVGGGVLDTQVIKGHVLARDTEGTIKHVTNAKIAVFSGGIDIAKTETKDTVLIKTADDLMNYNRSEEQAMEKIVKEISESGASVVVSGSTIGEMALHFMERYKIMVVKVPSKFELRRICRAVGATPFFRLGKPTPEELGHCDVVTSDEIGSTRVTVFRQEKEEHGQIATIVVRASTQNILDDVERSIDDGVNAFKALIQDNRFVSGAGSCEIELSKRLQSYGDSTPGLVQYAIKKFGEAFEVIPRTLADNAGLKSTDVISNLYASHQKGNTQDGIDVEEGDIKSAQTLGIFDSLVTKSTAIRLATEAILTILRVDQIIMSKPAGGPKPPKMGGRDED